MRIGKKENSKFTDMDKILSNSSLPTHVSASPHSALSHRVFFGPAVLSLNLKQSLFQIWHDHRWNVLITYIISIHCTEDEDNSVQNTLSKTTLVAFKSKSLIFKSFLSSAYWFHQSYKFLLPKTGNIVINLIIATTSSLKVLIRLWQRDSFPGFLSELMKWIQTSHSKIKIWNTNFKFSTFYQW